MDECEALCTRLSIMVKGGLKCLGSIQHLKNKFGSGYTLLVKVRTLNDTHKCRQIIENTFPTATLKDVHHCFMNYHVIDNNDNSVTLAALFGLMEKSKEHYAIEDYSVSQTTLEQVFVNFARSPSEPQVEHNGRCLFCRTWCCCCSLNCCDREVIHDHDDDDESGQFSDDNDTQPLV